MNNKSFTTNRSDMVRQRLQQQSVDRVNKTRRNATSASPRTAAPVTTRGVVSGMAYRPAIQQKVRKQYYYTVGTTGAELKIPSIANIRIGWRLLSAMLAIVCVAGLYLLFSAPEFVVQRIQTQGLQRVTAADLNAVIGVNGKSIVYANPEKISASITQAFPELHDVNVAVELPNTIRVTAVERKPALVWRTETQTFWLDEYGVLIPPRGEIGDLLTIQANALPPISHSAFSEQNSSETASNDGLLLSTAIQPPAQIQSWGDQVNPELVEAAYQLSLEIAPGTAIIFNAENGLGWKAQEGWDVFIGLTLNDIEYKLKAYQALVSQLKEEGITPSLVSIEYLHAPFYRE